MKSFERSSLLFARPFAIVLLAFSSLYGCGGGSSSDDVISDISDEVDSIIDDNTDDSDQDSDDQSDDSDQDSDDQSDDSNTVPTSITINGQAVAAADDVAEVATLFEKTTKMIAKVNPFQFVWAASETGSEDNDVLADATVTLYKIFADDATEDLQVDIGTVTTDSEGLFEIADLELAPEGSGADTDFYYEVRITKGDLELTSPAAPREDTEVDVSPESDLAAKILSEVVDVPGVTDAPNPSAAMIEATRKLVMEEATLLVDSNAINIPSVVGISSEDNVIAAANGISAGGGDSEKMFKAASFEAEYSALSNDEELTDEEATGYISRVTREGCNQAQGDYLPQALASELGEFFNAGNTTTPTVIVNAFNANSSGPDVVLATAVTNFKELLEGVETTLESATDTLTSDEQIALYTKRDLSASEFSATTILEADQATAFAQTLSQQQCSFSPSLDLFGFVADIVGNPALKAASIANSNVYHNSGFGCDEGLGKGHFYADVSIYTRGKTVSSVVITSTDLTALGGDATESLSVEGGGGLFTRYKSDSDGVCVDLGTDVTYTVTATFSDLTTVQSTVERNHPRIPEATSEVFVDGAFVLGSGNSSSPTVVDTSRPLYQWTSPDDELAAIINDSSNSAVKSDLESDAGLQVKYTYEFSHVDTSASQVGPASQCPQVSSGALYSVDSFIPTEDCDVQACATLLGTDPANIACRMNIQSYLVDQNDKILGQAAGHFRFFCVDLDGDDACG